MFPEEAPAKDKPSKVNKNTYRRGQRLQENADSHVQANFVCGRGRWERFCRPVLSRLPRPPRAAVFAKRLVKFSPRTN